MRGKKSLSSASGSAPRSWLARFLFPTLNVRFLVRVACVAIGAWLFFGHVCIPTWVRGRSMEPNWHDGEFTFVWRPAYWLRSVQRGDVVAIRLAGSRVMFLKRVIGLPGETVEFRDGVLYVDGERVEEPYVRYPCTWNLPAHKVREGRIYVVGDNRSMPPEQHRFGETDPARIVGRPLW